MKFNCQIPYHFKFYIERMFCTSFCWCLNFSFLDVHWMQIFWPYSFSLISLIIGCISFSSIHTKKSPHICVKVLFTLSLKIFNQFVFLLKMVIYVEIHNWLTFMYSWHFLSVSWVCMFWIVCFVVNCVLYFDLCFRFHVRNKPWLKNFYRLAVKLNDRTKTMSGLPKKRRSWPRTRENSLFRSQPQVCQGVVIIWDLKR